MDDNALDDIVFYHPIQGIDQSGQDNPINDIPHLLNDPTQNGNQPDQTNPLNGISDMIVDPTLEMDQLHQNVNTLYSFPDTFNGTTLEGNQSDRVNTMIGFPDTANGPAQNENQWNYFHSVNGFSHHPSHSPHNGDRSYQFNMMTGFPLNPEHSPQEGNQAIANNPMNGIPLRPKDLPQELNRSDQISMPPPPREFAVVVDNIGTASGIGIIRVLADPAQGNLAVAILGPKTEVLERLYNEVRQSLNNKGDLHLFRLASLSSVHIQRVFGQVRTHPAFQKLRPKLSVFHVQKFTDDPILATSAQAFQHGVVELSAGAFAFAQESLRLFHGGDEPKRLSAINPDKKGTIVFTGTIGALRAGSGQAVHSAGRSAVRMVAQAVGREHSQYGVQIVHVILRGTMRDVSPKNDAEVRSGAVMSADSIGRLYLWLSKLPPDSWIDELELRPALERW
ncbi:hypothetical protein HD806DRAFT_251580 [Xylariaceae sp. AK1471]|nr:hypothetical protein HD806DRAFT_251580 [Xylariaceae sp. AK1471]